MSASENKAFVRRYLDAINGKDKPAAIQDQYISDADAILKQHIAGYEAAFPRYALAVEDMFAEADKVALRFTMRATYGGGFMDIPATGQQVAVPGIIIYRIEDSKIVEHWMLVDSAVLMQQLGVQ
jgi:steroid delta-isomerase-like uncharacterized protein